MGELLILGELPSTCLLLCMHNHYFSLFSYSLSLTSPPFDALHCWKRSYFWNDCGRFLFCRPQLTGVSYSAVSPWARRSVKALCLKAWNHCEDLDVKPQNYYQELSGPFPYNYLNGFPRVMSAIGICVGDKISEILLASPHFSFSQSCNLVESI